MSEGKTNSISLGESAASIYPSRFVTFFILPVSILYLCVEDVVPLDESIAGMYYPLLSL